MQYDAQYSRIHALPILCAYAVWKLAAKNMYQKVKSLKNCFKNWKLRKTVLRLPLSLSSVPFVIDVSGQCCKSILFIFVITVLGIFSYIFVFSLLLTVNIKFAYEWIRPVDLWCRKWPPLPTKQQPWLFFCLAFMSEPLYLVLFWSSHL